MADGCFLHPPSSSAISVEGGSIGSFGSPHSRLEARNHWWLWHFLLIWQEIFSFHKCMFWYADHCLETNMNFYSGALSWTTPNQFPCIYPSFDCNWGIILKYPPGFLGSKGSETIILLIIKKKKNSFIYLVAAGLSCGAQDPVPWPGIDPELPALGVWSLSHWTTRKSPFLQFLLQEVETSLCACTH